MENSAVIRRNVLSIATSPPFPGFVVAFCGLLEILHFAPSSDLVSRKGKTGESCLHVAIHGSQVGAVSYLIMIEGMDSALQNFWGFNPLYFTSMLGFDDILSLLLEYLSLEYVCVQDQHGETALDKAAYHPREACGKVAGYQDGTCGPRIDEYRRPDCNTPSCPMPKFEYFPMAS